MNLAACRQRAGLRQQDVADKLGVSLMTYGSWERGTRAISFEQACALADLFSCSLDDLAGRDFSPDGPGDPRLARVVGAYEQAGEAGRALMAALVEVASRAR